MGPVLAVVSTFQRETLEQVWADALPLLAEQARALAPYPDIAFDPDLTAYRAAEASGCLRLFTVRASDHLVGYAVFFVRTNPHYQGSVQAVQDVLWLSPSHRRGGLGRDLLAYTEQQLRAEGCQVVLHHAKVKAPALAHLLVSEGYEMIDAVYGKRLDR